MPDRVLMVTWDGGGNVGPTVELGARLAARGVAVGAYGPAWLAGRFGAAGLGYEVRDVPDPWDAAAMAGDVAAACERAGADVAVVDYMLPGALLGAMAAGRPAVALVHTLYGALLADGAPHPMGMAATVEVLDAVAAGRGLDPVNRMGDVLDRCARVVVTAPAALDAPGPWPDNVVHVGAVLEGPGPDAGWCPPVPPDGVGGRPLVVVSLGTTPMDEGPVVEAVLGALAGEPVAVLALLGAHFDPATLTVPANATVAGYLRHTAVLPHAAATVCHAGLGTVLASLAAAVPLVCLPLGRDQPATAAAVARVGAGLALDPRAADAGAIRDAVGAVVAGGGYRTAAATIGAPASGPAADAVLAVF
jgi:hypothetical protein